MNSFPVFYKISRISGLVVTSGPLTRISFVVCMSSNVKSEFAFGSKTFSTFRPFADEVTFGLMDSAVILQVLR